MPVVDPDNVKDGTSSETEGPDSLEPCPEVDGPEWDDATLLGPAPSIASSYVGGKSVGTEV